MIRFLSYSILGLLLLPFVFGRLSKIRLRFKINYELFDMEQNEVGLCGLHEKYPLVL